MSDEQRPNGSIAYRFRKGQPGGPGRPKGSVPKELREIRKFSQKLFRRMFKDREFVRNLEDRLRRGKESPAIVALLAAYAYGKPPEKLIIEDDHASGTEHDRYREDLIERLCNRLTAINTTGGTEGETEQLHDGGAGGVVLELEACGETEPASSVGGLDGLADSGRTRMGQDPNRCGDDQDMG